MSQPPQKHGSNEAGWLSAAVLPYGLAIWCCLSILVGEPTDIPPLWIMATTIAGILGVIGILHAGLALFIRTAPRRELALFCGVAFVFLFGTFSNYATPILGEAATLIVWTALLSGLLFASMKFSQLELTGKLVTGLQFGLIVTLGFQVFNIATPVMNDLGSLKQFKTQLSDSNPLEIETAKNTESTKGSRPDIYYIIVDAYCRNDVLASEYGFDNDGFLREIRERGFFVGDESRSNYHLTETSLASSLNLTQLSDLELDRFATRAPIREMIWDSRVVGFLEQQGYQTIGFESGKSDTNCHAFSKFMPYQLALNEYQDVIYHNSILPNLVRLCGSTVRSAARLHGDRVLETFAQIPQAVKENDAPSFVFSHLLSPHPPFVFDEDGNEVEKYGYYLIADGSSFTGAHKYDTELYRSSYVAQLAFINKKLIEMVDAIQSKNRDSIIIIQGDHGPRLGFAGPPDDNVDLNQIANDPSMLADVNMRYCEGFAILNAICVPEKWKPDFYDSLTPVNTFGLIFNEVFGTKIERVSDESYFEDEYAFRDATLESMPQKQRTKYTISELTKAK